MANPTLDRATIYAGPAKMVHNSITYLFGEDFTVDFVVEWEDIAADAFGTVKRTVRDKRIEVSGRPLQWASLTGLFPYASSKLGTRVFGDSDLAAVITPQDGGEKPLTITNLRLIGMPPINLASDQAQIGQANWLGLCSNSSDPGAAASYYSFGSAAGSDVDLSGLTLSNLKRALYTATYNSVTYQSRAGFQVNLAVQTTPLRSDSLGVTVDHLITGVTAEASLEPIGLAPDALAALTAFGVTSGAEPTRYDLAIAGEGGITVTLDNCDVRQGQLAYGSSANRTRSLIFSAVRALTDGDLDALWTFA